MNNPRVIFAGTPDFALASLTALFDAGVRPDAVLTQPDRPAGRGRKLTASPVKRYAEEQGIVVQQPRTLRDPAAVEAIAALKPDVMIVAAYGLILPESVLTLPSIGCVNVHASLLPRWRGAAPIQAAILAGDAETGICLMQMDAGLDTGPVFAREAIPIDSAATAGSLHDALAALGGAMLVEHLPSILDGSASAVAQDDALATYAPKIHTSDAILDWRRSASELDRVVRAYDPVPAARFVCEDEQIKCWRGRVGDGEGSPGTVVGVDADSIEIACGDGSLIIARVQRPGKGPVSGAAFAAQLDLIGRQLGRGPDV